MDFKEGFYWVFFFHAKDDISSDPQLPRINIIIDIFILNLCSYLSIYLSLFV